MKASTGSHITGPEGKNAHHTESKYSMHSWRAYLACALLDAGASNATIQALLRWKSDEALKIYARMNKHTYADHLAKAGQAKVDSVRTDLTPA